MGQSGSGNQPWIGGTDVNSNNTIYWVGSGDLLPDSSSYWNTADGQPNHGGTNNCVNLRKNTGNLYTKDCSDVKKYVCERY